MSGERIPWRITHLSQGAGKTSPTVSEQDTVIAQIHCAANGTPTPHDGRYVVDWNPHTKAGVLELTSTTDKAQARRFVMREATVQWRTVSQVQPQRPWDGMPNRPLTAVTIVFERVE